MKALLLSFLMIFGVNVAADEMPKKVETDKQNWNFDGDIFMWAVPVGIIALGSKDPKTMGRTLVAISPTVGFSYKGGPTLPVYIVGSFLAGWGIYNINELDKNNYTYSQVLQRNMVIPLGAVALTFGVNRLLKKAKPDTKANINVTPLHDGAVFSLSSNF